jgi:hypothetical protein
MENLDRYEQIEAYLKGELSAEAAQAFELELAQNPELAEQVALHRLEWDAMEVLIENDLRTQMGDWKQTKTAILTPSVSEAEPPKMTVQKGGLSRSYAWAIAAELAILVVVGLWVLNRPKLEDVDMTRTDNPINKPIAPSDSGEILDGAMLLPDSLDPQLDSLQRLKDSLPK